MGLCKKPMWTSMHCHCTMYISLNWRSLKVTSKIKSKLHISWIKNKKKTINAKQLRKGWNYFTLYGLTNGMKRSCAMRLYCFWWVLILIMKMGDPSLFWCKKTKKCSMVRSFYSLKITNPWQADHITNHLPDLLENNMI